FLGDERYRKFVQQLNRPGARRLRFWQEDAWAKFVSEHPEFAATQDELRAALCDSEVLGCELSVVDKELMKEFMALAEAVSDGLRLRTSMNRRQSISVCQFIIWPAFTNPISWDVVDELYADERTRLYRSCWRDDLDRQAFLSPESRREHAHPFQPTIDVGW